MCASLSDPSMQECGKSNELAMICHCAHRKRLVSRNALNDPHSIKKNLCAIINSTNKNSSVFKSVN